ncbi:MAG: polysaccharide biosynthesis/export family protein [Hyphomicrobium sp.]|nr:polysaccharide biosynthesis/export family protein [Hyphomicrobium sp.]
MAPQNLEEVLYEPSKSAELSRGELTFVATQCPPPGEADFIMPASSRTHKSDIAGLTMRYSPGDRFNILIPGYPDYSGDYVINADGRVILPFAGRSKPSAQLIGS